MGEDDRKLIREVIAGNEESLGSLVRKYQAAVFAIALRRVGNSTVAEEIAQDTFITAYRKLDQLKDIDKFGSWLRTIVIRLCGKWLRTEGRKIRMHSLLDEKDPGNVPVMQQFYQDREGTFGIGALIKELPEGLREAAVLCLEEEVSPSAAAEVLGLKPGTLRKRLHDARARLQGRIVEKAERELRLHLLPKDFAERCVCRCGKAQEVKKRKEVETMAKKNCGCGCLELSKGRDKPKVRKKPKKRK